MNATESVEVWVICLFGILAVGLAIREYLRDRIPQKTSSRRAHPACLAALPILLLPAICGTALVGPVVLVISAASITASAILAGLLRNRLIEGILLGALLGPLGIGAVFLLADFRCKCPHCIATVPTGATVCRRCGRDL